MTSAHLNSSNNYSLHSLAAAYALAAAPAMYCFQGMMVASGGQWNNALPRQNFERLQGKVPQAVWEKCFRAKGAHLNGLEHFPLFVAAMIAGNLAKLPSAELNSFAASYLAIRVVFTLLYINTTSNRWSYLRSAVWFECTALCLWKLVQAGIALNTRGE